MPRALGGALAAALLLTACTPHVSVVEAGGFTLAVARTIAQRERGLMGVRRLTPRHGMVFVMPPGSRPVFWMKGCELPLDMVFVGQDGRALAVVHADPPAPGEPLKLYTPLGVETEVSLVGRDLPSTCLVIEVQAGEGDLLARSALPQIWAAWRNTGFNDGGSKDLRRVL